MSRAVSLLFHDVFATDPAESGFVSDAANRYKLSIGDFEAQIDGIARSRIDAPIASSPSGARPRDVAQVPWLLTFDDGGVSYYTLIADRLEMRGWRGHCFVTTDLLGRRGFLDTTQLRELDARGHVIGSHSASHPTRFSACPYPQMVTEWRQSRAVLEDILGHAVTTASIPGGYFSPSVARSAHEAGISVLFTSEPVTAVDTSCDITLLGRFTIRHGDRTDTAMRLVSPSSWARTAAWLRWNAKGIVKPLLGPAYTRIADRICALRRLEPRPAESTDRCRS